MNNYNIITVVNAISPTSMPINEFLLYRRKIYGEKGSVLTISPLKEVHKNIFKDLKIISFRNGILSFIKYLWDNSNQILHLHQPKSALLVVLITIILPKRFFRVVTIHNNFEKFKMITRLLVLFNSLFATSITFVSHSSYNSFPKIFKFLFKNKCKPITNGVDVSRVDVFLKDKIVGEKTNESIELIYIGKLHKQKNHDKLINIFSKLPKTYRLTIVGEGEDRKKVTDKINRLNLNDRITITGIVPREQVYDLLIKSDIFVSTALWEGMPIGVLEAMSCYLPVILSKIPPHVEIQNESGINFICDSIDEFISKIQDYANFSSKERLDLGIKNRKVVEDNFILSIMHKQYDLIYNKFNGN